MESNIVKTGIAFIIIGIILGAFGAHALANILSEAKLASFKTGVFYMLFHGLALIVLSNITQLTPQSKKRGALGIILGTVFFSGSIYVLSFSENIDLGVTKSVLGPITPIGGALLIVSWITLLLGVNQPAKK